MARRVYEGTLNLYWAESIADITAPTSGELAAATDITCLVTKDGWQPNITTNNVDSAALCDRVDAQIPGSVGADCSITGFRDDANDDLWDLWEYGQEGYIIAEPFGTPNQLPAPGAKVEVYHGTMHQKSPSNSAANTQQTFTAPFPVLAFELDAVVDGS